MCGNLIKVRFFSMTNVDGSMYAKFDVLSPRKVLCEDRIIDLTKLSDYSKSLRDGMFVGVEQTKKDSLYTPKGITQTWTSGHKGYINLFNTLLVSDEIREVLGVNDCWDGEWEKDEVLDGLTEKQIQQKIDDYKNNPFISGYAIMSKLFSEMATLDNFESEEFLNSFVQKCKEYNIPKEVYEHYINFDIKLHWGGEVKKLLAKTNDTKSASEFIRKCVESGAVDEVFELKYKLTKDGVKVTDINQTFKK